MIGKAVNGFHKEKDNVCLITEITARVVFVARVHLLLYQQLMWYSRGGDIYKMCVVSHHHRYFQITSRKN